MINLHKKLIGESPMVYNAPAAAIVASSLISTGVGMYQAEEQKSAAEEAAAKAEAERRRQEEEALRISRDTRPEAQSATGISYGVDTGETDKSDFLVRKTIKPKSSSLGTSGTSGLGYV